MVIVALFLLLVEVNETRLSGTTKISGILINMISVFNR
jgi:hypothetical protein